MGTESPDTERMHRLLGDALEDTDLNRDVVPAVLAGYEHRVKVRRYQGAGAALAVLAIAGVAVAALPRGGTAGPSAAASPAQGPDYCRHQHWGSTPGPTVELAGEPARDPSADQAACEAMTTALRAVFPDARLVPAYTPDLALDARLDQRLVTKVLTDLRTNPFKGQAEDMKDFGSELKYLGVHPEDPANVYQPSAYTLITAAGREAISVGPTTRYAPDHPESFVGSADSNDCEKVPAALTGKAECTPVGTAGGWHGVLWKTSDTPTAWVSLGVLTDGPGRSIRLSTDGYDVGAWYPRGTYEGIQSDSRSPTWVNRWTGQTFTGANPPRSHALSQRQWAEFLSSPAFQKFADSYQTYISNLS